jgi:PST family polysaccharide transporter
VPLVYALGQDGVVPALVAAAASAAAASWWYSRRIGIAAPAAGLHHVAAEAKALLKLGLAFMGSGMLTSGAAYAVRIIVLRKAGIDAAGIYLAAWTLGGLYIGFVLQALGTDFYPRLVGAARDNAECNRLVNEQAQVSLLLAVPGVLATLSLAPLAIPLFYSSGFSAAVPVLRWICLGMALRVFTWPLGYIVVAKNLQALFFALELAWTLVNIGLTWWCVGAFGVDGAGMAFFGAYLFHALLLYPVVRRLSGFRWSTGNRHTAACGFALVALVFAGFVALPPAAAIALGALSVLASGYAAARILVHLAPPQRLPRPLARLLRLGRLPR